MWFLHVLLHVSFFTKFIILMLIFLSSVELLIGFLGFARNSPNLSPIHHVFFLICFLIPSILTSILGSLSFKVKYLHHGAYLWLPMCVFTSLMCLFMILDLWWFVYSFSKINLILIQMIICTYKVYTFKQLVCIFDGIWCTVLLILDLWCSLFCNFLLKSINVPIATLSLPYFAQHIANVDGHKTLVSHVPWRLEKKNLHISFCFFI